MSRRARIQIYNRTVVTDESAVADAVFTGRKVRHLGPPWALSVLTADANTAPSGTISIQCIVQTSADGTTWSAVPGGLTNAPITAAGAQTASKGNANQWDEWVRCVNTSTAATWAAGTVLTAYLIGETRAT